MGKIAELTEQLASTVMMADATDLPVLAQLHEQLQSVAQASAELTDAAQSASVQQAASTAVQLVEKIILRDVTDANAALRQVCQTITELQGLIKGTPATPAPQPPAATPDAAPAGEPAAPQAAPTPGERPIEAETPINPEDAPLVREFISEALEHLQSAEAALLQLEENPRDMEGLGALFRSFHTIKGVAGFLNFKQIGALAHAAESLLDLARNGKLLLNGPLVDVVLLAIDLLKAMITSVDEAVKNNSAPARQDRLPDLLQRLHAAAAGTLAPNQEGRGAMDGAATSATPEPNSPAEKTPEDHPQETATETPNPAAAPKNQGAHDGAADTTIKVATDRLDSLINMTGELVIAQAMVRQDLLGSLAANQRLSRNMSHMGKIARALQDLSMSMRMVPIQGVFQKMARLVRDVARKALKEVDFVVTGGETELDRNVVEAISDPLVHMVRNSVDHGVEPTDQRLAAGKPRAGRVELKAYHQAGNIVIQISDDGRGLNKERLLQKAIAAGIVRPGEQLDDQEIFKLVFHAGLSTAEKITDISGRGVGMDVVKRNVDALRGRIDIASTQGQGSTFTIRLPLTLAVIDGQIVRVGPHRYIIPIHSIEQSIQPKADQLSTVQNRGEMCMVRGDLLPLSRLHRLFSVRDAVQDPTKALLVIVQDDKRRCGLLVDELLGQQQVVIKSLGEALGHVPGISGGAILGDGNVSLILDIPGLITLAAGK
jgi:two-component system chemotaxis sensor kinase CheA